jgi:TRAP-type mannitol/chloroaromatic compound transport system permease small subunit
VASPPDPKSGDPAALSAKPSLALPHTRLSARIDRFLVRIGDCISWVWLLLVAVIISNVVLRYAFGAGRIEFEELQWHLYAVGFLAGLSYCVQADAHVRIDVLHERLRPRLRAWIELYGILLLLFPFVSLICVYAVPFVADAFRSSEISPSPGGLPYRWVIKAALVGGFALLALAGVSRLMRVWMFLFGVEPDTHAGHR